MNTLLVNISEAELAAICRRWKIAELAVFGSALRPEFSPESDVDLLVTYAPDARWSLFDEGALLDELETLFGRKVDLLSRRAVEQSANPIRKQAILESATPLYVESAR